MKIASWNVNSIRARLPTVLEVLSRLDADVVCLQEIKCVTDAFPFEEIEAEGYSCAVAGQKSYNGVAILSRSAVEDVVTGLPGLESDQARYIEAVVAGPVPVRVGSIYVPNGNPCPGLKFDAKRAFMAALAEHAHTLLAHEEFTVLAGDYNCIPRDQDCWDPSVWSQDALAHPETRSDFRSLEWQGYTDAFMAMDGGPGAYTFWDYQAGCWPKDHGVRIDHALLSPRASDRLAGFRIDREARGLTKPSDHVPVVCELEV